MIRLAGLAAAIVVSLAAAPSIDDSAADQDLKKLEGEWVATNPDGSSVSYTFKGKRLKIVGPTRTYEMSITIDPEAKPEKTIDLKIEEGPDDAKGKTSKGIYKFDGDEKFIFCFTPEGDRPAKYEQVGFEQFVMELKKKK